MRSLQHQADEAAAAAAAHQLSVELSLKSAIKHEQQQKAAVMEACRWLFLGLWCRCVDCRGVMRICFATGVTKPPPPPPRSV